MMEGGLSSYDSEVFKLCQKEKNRQIQSIELIASENFISKNVAEALSCCFHNKYSEGYPGSRYYGGNEVVDELEILCQKRALDCFKLDPLDWGVNVQCYSGSTANFAVYNAFLGPGGKLMGLNLLDGGHLTHGYVTPKGNKLSASSIYFESRPYFLSRETWNVDFDQLDKLAAEFKPGMIIAGTSSFSRVLDYKKFREICDKTGAILLADIAHISGLIAGEAHPSPFGFADIVTTTTHKSLRGPRHAMIFYRKRKLDGQSTDYESKINASVFPGLQGGPHNHTMAALTVALKEASTSEFAQYQLAIVKNARSLCKFFMEKGIKVFSNGTDNHICILDLSESIIDGIKLEHMLELVNISTNRNTLPTDKNALKSNGIRLGTPAMTSRNLQESDFNMVAEFIYEAIQIAETVEKMNGNKTLKEFKDLCSEKSNKSSIENLRTRVIEFASLFPMPGLNY